MSSIGGLTIEMAADIARLRRDMDDARKAVGNSMAGIQRAVDMAKTAFVALAGAASLGAFVAMIKGAIDAADALDEMSGRIGVSASELSSLQLAYRQAGMDGSAMASSMAKLSKEMSDGNKGLAALSINTRNADGSLRGTTGVLLDIADKFAGMEDGAGKTALAMEIFGKSGAEMVPLLNSGSAGIREMIAMSEKLGLVISDETAAAAGQFNDTLELVGMGAQGVGQRLAAQLLPTLNSLAGSFLESMTQGDRLRGVADALGSGLKILYSIGVGVASAFSMVGKTLGTMAAQAMAIMSGDFSGAMRIGDEWRAEMTTSWQESAKQISSAWDDQAGAAVAATAKIIKSNRDVMAEAKAREEAEKLAAEARKKAASEAAAEAKKQAEAYDAQVRAGAELMLKILDRNDVLMQEIELGRSLTAAELEGVEITRQVAAGKIVLSEAEQAVARALLAENAQIEANAAWLRESAAANAAAGESLAGNTAALLEQVQQQQAANEAAGLSAEQIARLEIAKLRETAATKERNAALMDEIDWSGQTGAEYRKQAAALRELATLKEQGIHIQTAKDSAAEWKKTTDSIYDGLTDALMRAFESGKGFADAFKSTLVNAFKTMILKPTIQAILAPMAGGMGSMLGAGNASASPAGGGMDLGSIGQLASFAKMAGTFGSFASTGFMSAGVNGMGTTFGAAQGLFGAGQTAGAAGMAGGALAAGAAGIMGGRAIGQGISNGFAMGGGSGNSAVNVGTAIGMAIAGPLGAVVGGALGGIANRAFGRKTVDDGIEGTLGGRSGFTGNNFTDQKGGWFRSDRTLRSAIDVETQSALSQSVALIKGTTRDYAAALGMGSASIDSYTQAIRISLKGLSAEQQQQAIATALGSFADGLAVTLGAGLAAVALKGETSSQTLARLATSIGTVNRVLDTFGDALLRTSVQGADAASKLIDAFGGAEAFAAGTSAYFDAFYTDSERAAATTKQLTAALAALGLQTPATRAEFRRLVNAQDLTTDAGRRTYATLIGLSGAFASVTDALGATGDAASATAEAATQASTSLLAEIKRLRGTTDAAGGATELQAQFATATAQARAGDAAALASLPDISKALDQIATATAQTEVDAARMRAWLAASLGDTVRALGGTVPAFAAGGQHAGGWRLVGEDGPELEATGPARIFNAGQTAQMLDGRGAGNNEALLAELRSLRAEVSGLRAESQMGDAQLASHARKTATYLERVIDGTDAVRTTT